MCSIFLIVFFFIFKTYRDVDTKIFNLNINFQKGVSFKIRIHRNGPLQIVFKFLIHYFSLHLRNPFYILLRFERLRDNCNEILVSSFPVMFFTIFLQSFSLGCYVFFLLRNVVSLNGIFTFQLNCNFLLVLFPFSK